MNTYYLLLPYPVSHDSAEAFESFYFFYNHFYFNHNIAQWMPYYSFGVPSQYWQLYALTPVSCFFILLGCLCKANNVLFVFKLSIIVEQMIFLCGLYLLSKKLFTQRGTVLAVCLGGIASAFTYENLPSDFRILYLLPLAVYFLVRFIQEKRPEFFWLCGITVLAWDMGNALYFIFLWTPLLVFLGSFLILKQGRLDVFKCLTERSFRNAGLILLFCVAGLCFFYQLKTFADFIDFLSRPAEGKNNLFQFLTYANTKVALQDYFNRFVLGLYPGSYVGLLPLMLCFWNTQRLKHNAYYQAFFLATIGLLWFSFAGIGASLMYFFPGMPYYRHLIYVYGPLKVLVLICAGFKLEIFWNADVKEKNTLIFVSLFIFLFLADALGLSKDWLTGLLADKRLLSELQAQMNFHSPLFRFAIYPLAAGAIFISTLPRFKGLNNVRLIKAILLAALCLDIASFHYQVYKEVLQRSFPLPKEFEHSLWTHREGFEPQRSESPQDGRALDVLLALNNGHKYATIYSVAQFSPCVSSFRLDLQPIEISRLLSAATAGSQGALKEVMGCDAPKLRLENSPPMSLVSPVVRPDLSPGQVQVTHFNSDELTLRVDAPAAGAWLVYADSYHPGWQAMVNGKKQPIVRVYGAFKALRLNGHNDVEFYFNSPVNTLCSWFLMLFGTMSCIFLIGLLVKTLYESLI